jgi:hypothetical protein
MNEFCHLLLTQFNVAEEASAAKKSTDLDWLNHRFDLFERYCYPTVRAQVNASFRWLVFLNARTPDAFKDRVREYAKWPVFAPIYIDVISDEAIRQAILAHLPEGTRYLITSRVDTDDGLCRDFMRLVQSQFDRQARTFINFANGFVLHDEKLYLRRYPGGNSFVSLIESVDGFRGIFFEDHTQISKWGPIKEIQCKPAWLQVIHHCNLVNTVQGMRCPLKHLAADFPIKVSKNRFSMCLDTLAARSVLFKHYASRATRRALHLTSGR